VGGDTQYFVLETLTIDDPHWTVHQEDGKDDIVSVQDEACGVDGDHAIQYILDYHIPPGEASSQAASWKSWKVLTLKSPAVKTPRWCW